jgi:RNA polymerase sigma factor (TIGR02999 family)
MAPRKHLHAASVSRNRAALRSSERRSFTPPIAMSQRPTKAATNDASAAPEGILFTHSRVLSPLPDAGVRPLRERAINDESKPLFALVYQELRRIARRQRWSAGSPPTLDTTVLLHETYLKLHASVEAQAISREHFLSLAARAMRQVLVDHARRRGRIKRGGFALITDLDENRVSAAVPLLDMLALDDALTRLAEQDPRAGQLVEWHVFGGLGIDEIAALQGLTERTAFRDWRRARAFLVSHLEAGSAREA